jgi:tetrahydromethanopterin S-methyltransferase subunit G
MDVSKRLEKLEDKIDKLSEAVIAIARIEERVTTVLKQNDRFIARLDRLEDRVEVVEQTTKLNKKDVSNGERVFWIVFSAVIAAIMYTFR